MDNRKKGAVGEDIASIYLKNKGYKILQRNFYTRYGEIDIIASKDDTIIFVEVKKRSTKKYGIGAEAVTQKKIDKIHICTNLYLQENKLYNQKIRFDVIDIIGNKNENINHIIAAF